MTDKKKITRAAQRKVSGYGVPGNFNFKKASHDEKVQEKKALKGDKKARKKELLLESMLKKASGH